MDDEERSIRFGQRLQRTMSTRVEPFRWGTVYFDDEFPLRYGSNILWVEGDPDVTGEELQEDADRILGGAGFDHRVILVDPTSLFDRLEPHFRAQGWSATQFVLMILRRPLALTRSVPAARHVPHSEAVSLLERHVRAFAGRDERTVRTLSEYPGKLERQFGARLFVAESDGVAAASCELYIDGDEAQVESVQTLEAYRGRRLGTAVVTAAVHSAQQSGAEWIHLYADEGGWQLGWYESLGFERAGTFGEFSRHPEPSET